MGLQYKFKFKKILKQYTHHRSKSNKIWVSQSYPEFSKIQRIICKSPFLTCAVSMGAFHTISFSKNPHGLLSSFTKALDFIL